MARGRRTRVLAPAAHYPSRQDAASMGAEPPSRYDHFPYDSGYSRRANYFRNYRNETLSRFMSPPCEWINQSTSYTPKANFGPNLLRSTDRSLAVPINNISTIDSLRMGEIDDFYKCVQLQREQYKDRTGRLHPLRHFRPDGYNFESSPSLFTKYLLKCPETYTAYKVPPVLPLTYERTLKAPYLPGLAIPAICARANSYDI